MLQKMSRSADGLVLHDASGAPLEYTEFYESLTDEVLPAQAQRFPTPADEVGFANLRPHGFRHFFCSQAFIGSAGEGEVKEWMGHSSTKMGELYRHLRTDDSRRKMQQISFLNASPDVPAAV